MRTAFKLFRSEWKWGKEGKLKRTNNEQLLYAELPLISKWKQNAHPAFTSYLKTKESVKRGEPNPPNHPHGDTGTTGVVTRLLTGGEISSPSQP